MTVLVWFSNTWKGIRFQQNTVWADLCRIAITAFESRGVHSQNKTSTMKISAADIKEIVTAGKSTQLLTDVFLKNSKIQSKQQLEVEGNHVVRIKWSRIWSHSLPRLKILNTHTQTENIDFEKPWQFMSFLHEYSKFTSKNFKGLSDQNPKKGCERSSKLVFKNDQLGSKR